jgi:hypothetical protein
MRVVRRVKIRLSMDREWIIKVELMSVPCTVDNSSPRSELVTLEACILPIIVYIQLRYAFTLSASFYP